MKKSGWILLFLTLTACSDDKPSWNNASSSQSGVANMGALADHPHWVRDCSSDHFSDQTKCAAVAAFFDSATQRMIALSVSGDVFSFGGSGSLKPHSVAQVRVDQGPIYTTKDSWNGRQIFKNPALIQEMLHGRSILLRYQGSTISAQREYAFPLGGLSSAYYNEQAR